MSAPQLGPGQVVAGRYTVQALLGFSGEAASYHAVASSGHAVVLKLYDPAVGQRADVMGKLERVRSTLAQLPIELVVPVADDGYDMSTSAPFSVCEYVQLPSLAQLCQQGPLAPGVVAKIIEGVARALDTSHAYQLYHLALKPANVFVGPAPYFPVRLADFGASVVRSTSPTHEAYAHSAPWWAPEQLQPAAMLGGPADVFATALIAFYALAGRSYWQSCQSSPPDLQSWQLEIMAARAPASQRAAQFGAALNSAIDGVFARALSLSQADRPRSAMEIAGALAGVSAGAYRSDYGTAGAAKTMDFAEGEQDPYAQALAAASGTAFEAGQAYAAAPGPYELAQNDYGAPAPGYGGGSGGYAAPAGQLSPQPPGAQERPGLPPVAPQPKKTGSSKPIVIGIVAAVLIGGAGTAFLFLRPRFTRQPAPSASATAVAEASTSESAAPPAPPPPPTTPASTTSDSSAPEPPPPDEKIEVTLICTPQCDELFVDNEKIDKLVEKNKLAILPGKHTLEARKSGFVTIKETIDIEKPIEKELRLAKIGALPPARKCGGLFLKCK